MVSDDDCSTFFGEKDNNAMENNDDTVFEEISIVDDEIKERGNDEITQPFENSGIDDMIEIPSHINHSEENDINENDIDERFQDEYN